MRQNGLSTQCIQTRTANSRNDMTLAQLCLKVNTKMGGINNYINRDRITRSVSLHALNSFFFIILQILRVLFCCGMLNDFSTYQQSASIKAYFGT